MQEIIIALTFKCAKNKIFNNRKYRDYTKEEERLQHLHNKEKYQYQVDYKPKHENYSLVQESKAIYNSAKQ